ncbi:MAG TPA: hypothetical protein PKD58_12655 [Candidatus Sumerlaeota bacterium]|nr:hypothetical protein [Candidatus Sumerlaeota bacterium]
MATCLTDETSHIVLPTCVLQFPEIDRPPLPHCHFETTSSTSAAQVSSSRQPENPGNANPDINRVVADYIQTLPFIAFADTTEALLHVPVNGDPLRQSFVYAHYPQRAGGVVFALKPYYYFSSGTGTTHGSPWRYDQFVPLFICGKGIGPGRSSFPVSPPQIAPTISQMLQIPLPAKCEVTAIPGALLNRM